MSIGQRFSKKHNRRMWGFDERFADGAGGKKRVRIYEFDTRRDAEQALAAVRRVEREAKFGVAPLINRPTLHELIVRRLPAIQTRSERTRARRVLFTWLSLLDPKVRLNEKHEPTNGYHSMFKVDEVKTGTVRVYVENRQADGQSASSINRELATIAATLNQAGESFPELEQWKKPRMPRLKVAKSRRERLISNDEYARLVAHLRRPPDELDGDARPQNRQNAYECRVRVAQILQFAMLTGARHGEIVALKWRDVSWEREKILIYQTKTASYKEIPLIPSLAALLDERNPEKGVYVFTETGHIYPKFYKILRCACERLNIPYGKNTEDGLLLHTARHTVTTRLVEAGLDYDTIGMITGHKAKELIAHYSHKHPGSVARAAAALEQISGRRSPVKNDEGGDG